MSKTDPDLIERARSGDRDAFGKLVVEHQRRVYATARRMVGTHADADDIAQEAFMRAYRGLKGFDGRADFFTWLYRIVVNVALNHIRARAGKKTAPEASGSTDPTGQIEARDRVRRTEAALCELPETLRAAIVLHVVEGLSQAQVAEILECAEGTVAWRVNQARKLLRDRLGESGTSEESHD